MKTESPGILRAAVIVAAIMVLATTSTPAARSDDSREKKLRDAAGQSAKAANVLEAIMGVPDQAIPRELMTRAKAIAVFPQVIKVALKVGGEGGRGVVSRRTSGGGWADPVFLRAGGGSVGPQVGASSTDFVLLLMSDDSVKGLMKDRFELGGGAAVAAGPVGRNAGAGTDALLRAEILSYSRSRGLFAGANLKGVVLRPEDDLNVAVYHKTASELLADEGRAGSDDEVGLKAFPQALGRYTDSADR
jgi:lipid-binding SYLF domain-containing protein